MSLLGPRDHDGVDGDVFRGPVAGDARDDLVLETGHGVAVTDERVREDDAACVGEMEAADAVFEAENQHRGRGARAGHTAEPGLNSHGSTCTSGDLTQRRRHHYQPQPAAKDR